MLTRVCVESLLADPDVLSESVCLVENGMESELNISGVQRIRLERNMGYGAAVNVGCHALFHRGYVAALVLNNDLRYVRGTLRIMVNVVDSSRIGCVGAVLDEHGGVVYGGGIVDWFRCRAHHLHQPHRRISYISGACFLITKACFEDVRGVPEHYFLYWEDVALSFLLRKRGWQFVVAKTPPLRHVGSLGTQGRPEVKTYYMVRNGVLFAREYAPWLARWWLRFLEPIRLWCARYRHRWPVFYGLLHARRGVTGPLSPTVNLSSPPV